MTSHASQPKAAAGSDTGSLRHVAIIMDGNGRWAERRGLPRSMGHHAGVEAVRRTVDAALERGIGYLTLYSFSSENWSRPIAEVEFLFGLLRM
jgi:undecaprenyl diphosphate synthase